MAESAVSFLLEQLSVLLRDETKLLGGLEGEVEYIQGEMMQMKEFLRVADQKEESNPGLKEWVSQLREISYDVEDVLDKFMLRFGQHRGTNGFSGCLRKTYDSVKNLSARRQIATEIEAIKKRLETVSTSQQRYRDMYSVMDQGTGSTIPRTQGNYGRGDALFLDEADVVGIGKSKDQLLEWIGSMDSGLEVISVVGMGGLGKTTLVKKVYDDESTKRRFSIHVWIVASEYKDDKQLLTNLIKKLVGEFRQPPPQELEDMNLDEMRNFIYEFLKEKNYIIVVDDVWDISTWNAIKPPLPKRDVHGCVILTTRDSSIADAACCETNHVYNLQPLDIEESKVLFYKKAFPRNLCPTYLREFAENILKRCGGLPLAIVVIGGLLATKDNTAEEWEMFNRSLGHELEGGSLQILGKILSLSYSDLPYYLKYCYLYLSIFPEDDLLEKEKIIRLWIAEGFVQPKESKTMEEVAAGYLYELSSRSLVQVAERHIDGRVRAFRVHDLLRDYILSKSRELNIVTVSREGEMQWPGIIRRFVIQKSFNFSRETNNFKCLRSLILMCSENVDVGIINELVRRCRLLKVLDLRGAPLETIPSEVFKLYHLKYLCLRNTMIKLIPKSIKYLQNLETLDLKNSDVTELPSEILKLHRLQHLLVYNKDFSIQSFKAPCDIGSHLPWLVKLSCVDADEKDGIKIVKEIGKLTQLRRLGIAKLRSEDGKDLCSSIANLTQLRSLRIQSIEEGERLELDYPLRLPFLRTLQLIGCIEKLPQWISSLNGLTTLYLRRSRLREDPLMCIQDLPNLTRLIIHGAYVEELSFKAEGFQKLKELVLWDLKFMKGVIVEKGCMPFLEVWNMEDCSMVIELPQGMEHLINLQYVSFVSMAKEFVDKAVELKRNEGDDWRLAHVPNVVFGSMIDGGSLDTGSPWVLHNSKYGNMSMEQNTMTEEVVDFTLFCSIFPSDYEFTRDILVWQWIAGGWLTKMTDDETMENACLEGFDTLLSMNYIVPSGYDHLVDQTKYKFGDKMISFLQEQQLEPTVRKYLDNRQSDVTQVQHLSLAFEQSDGIEFEALKRYSHLQSLVINHCYGSKVKYLPSDLFLELKDLKMLNLSRTGIVALPSSVENLKELRFLDVSETPISWLPETIRCFSSLQTLKLDGCLSLRRLPKCTNELINLRQLVLDVARQLQSMPLGIGKLSKLQTLTAYLVGEDDGCRIGELKDMNKLRGSLRIMNLENVETKEEAEEACLFNKLGLKKLELQWSDLQDEKHTVEEGVLESLQPPFGIHELKILFYSGGVFPSWISNPLFGELVKIILYRCRYCCSLPSLGELPSLKHLTIIENNEVTEIGSSFCRNGVSDHQQRVAFPSLEKLSFDSMSKLEKWTGLQNGDFPSLRHLVIEDCPKFASLPILSHLTTLLHLEISYCPELPCLPEGGLPSTLESLMVKDCPKLAERYCDEDWPEVARVPGFYINNQKVCSSSGV